MGFLDKAKKMAEQAQSKIDEVQKQFNESQGQGSAPSGPVVEYDKHGRPIGTTPPPEAPPAPAPPAAEAPPVADAPPAPVPPPVADTPPAPVAPAASPQAPQTEDRNHPSYEPPKLTSGDPLAG
jgi:hypothetical protein